MRFALGLVLGAVLFPALARAEDGKKDAARLKGTWSIIARDSGTGPKDTDGFKLIITDKDITFRAPNGATKKMGDISRIDGSTNPAQIDLKLGDQTGFGIYELKGTALKLIVRDPGEERPKEFKGTAKGILFTLKRDGD
jgi:uncharacterized protein (TIGR03067 family)